MSKLTDKLAERLFWGDSNFSHKEIREILAELDWLEAEINRLERNNQWIFVSKQLPPTGIDVLMTDGESVGFGTLNDIDKKVVAWRPIPEPPQKKG